VAGLNIADLVSRIGSHDPDMPVIVSTGRGQGNRVEATHAQVQRVCRSCGHHGWLYQCGDALCATAFLALVIR
jgi:hypothetical protein